LETDPRAIKEAKKPYQDMRFEGQVESRFLYATLLSTDLLPFGHLDFRLTILPILPQGSYYRLINAEQARRGGFLHLAGWLDNVEVEWEKKRSRSAEKLTAVEWLDYRKKLTDQNPKTKYCVIYNALGTFLAAAIVENADLKFYLNGQEVNISGNLNDYKIYYFRTSNKDEASYLTAILNSPIVDTLIKPMQARGLWGPRGIEKKVMELSIPRFKSDTANHIQLAELGAQCAQKVRDWLDQGGPGQVSSIGRLRGMVRQMLKAELEEIDGIVTSLIGIEH
jgi:hypothetical protein